MSTNKNLDYKRRNIKSRLTIFENYLKKLDVDNVTDDRAVFELQQRLSDSTNLINEFNDVQSEIEMSAEEPKIDETERDDFSNKYYKCIAACRTLLEYFLSQKAVVANKNSSNNQQKTQLPTLSLPEFNGNIDNWLEFRDSFLSMVHNTAIDRIQKFHYLKSCLTGPAASILKSLTVSDANYETAWDLICNRYDNTNILIFNHVKSLCNLPKIHKSSSKALQALIDEATKNLRSLNSLNLSTDNWDVLLVHILSEKLDSETLGKWEEHKFGKDLPTFDTFTAFIESRAKFISASEKISDSKDNQKFRDSKKFDKGANSSSHSKSFVSSSIQNCLMCNEAHKLAQCNDFIALSPEKRFEKAKSFKICLNCLDAGHFANKCSKISCNKCSSKHNVLLHFEKTTKQDIVDNSTKLAMTSYSCSNFDVLLSTAKVLVIDSKGMSHECRVLLDCGSQTNFVCIDFCKRLNLKTKNVKMTITGINQVTSPIEKLCTVKFKSRLDDFTCQLDCLVVPEICSNIPAVTINLSNVPIPNCVDLADPDFNISGKIDMLIGAEVFWDIVCNERMILGKNLPVLNLSKLGWIVSGRISTRCKTGSICALSVGQIQEQLSMFWELEECPNSKLYSPEEIECERHFIETTKRDSTGRFVVSIPLSEDEKTLGNSKVLAEKRFCNLERKLTSDKNELLKTRYHDFIQEYIALGHMSPIKDRPDKLVCYLPHHGVLKEQSATTKLRVVFDASALTSSGRSLNSIQMVGPTVQEDLFSILIRFRQYAYVVAADIAKMYRQVLVDPKQRNLQCILWRFDKSQPLCTYQLNTITYGTAAAAYLATRCLKQLSVEAENPVVSNIIGRDFYVDDLLSSFSSKLEAIDACKEVNKVLLSGGFELRKWTSNDLEIVEAISGSSGTLADSNVVEIGSNETAKTLGLLWSSKNDTLMFNIETSQCNVITKRLILSAIAKIFDPLGLLAPCIIKAKVLLQQLWLKQLEWDDRLPMELENYWLDFHRNLSELNKLSIKRQTLVGNLSVVEIHGFADSSERAYGACVYLKSYSPDGDFCVQLLCAKSKVAPLKLQTIPKLELCAILILAKLVTKVKESLTVKINHTYLWSDSAVALNWIQTPPHILKTFVAHRVSQVQSLTGDCKWLHVSSKDNVADVISRGLSPLELLNCDKWWNGPSFLSSCNIDLNKNILTLEEIPEIKTNKLAFQSVQNDINLFERFSSFMRLKRVVAYCLRFKNNCLIEKGSIKIGPLSVDELEASTLHLVKIVQREGFPDDLKSLSSNSPLSKSSKVRNLCPYLDNNGIIRVGGRLSLSEMAYDRKHPILLPKNHKFVDLWLRHEHIRLGHAGPQLLLYSIREYIWPLSGINAAKRIASKCIECFHVSPRTFVPQMGNLPESRVTANLPFTIAGVDYAGPFLIKNKRGRGSNSSKCYIALFVCFATKALHLELVTDLSKDAFLAALNRFIARRGKPCQIHSDNGTNFVGASNDLRDLAKFFKSYGESVAEDLSNIGITWKFIAPHSPHLGGLWEAGVKSIKYH